MKTLLDKVESVYSTLFGSATYDNPEGGTIAMRGYVGAIPHKRDTEPQGEDFPFRLTKLSGFDLTREGTRYQVTTEIGLYEASDDVADGILLVDSVMQLIESLTRQSFAPFKIIGEAQGELLGDRHPFYVISITHTFKGTYT